MREDGLIIGGSPVGTWEISEAGRDWLAQQQPMESAPNDH